MKQEGRFKVWHKDGDESNNWYKNLLTVCLEDYEALKAGKITWQELNLEQEYIEYENKASFHAYKIYDGILARCVDTKDNDNIRACYDKSTMWQGWLDAPKAFVKWYLEHYYECGDEEINVDKDLFGDGSGMYAPGLKNCPFCGSKAAFKKYNSAKDEDGNRKPDGIKTISVICDKGCFSASHFGTPESVPDKHTIAYMAYRWNQRKLLTW